MRPTTHEPLRIRNERNLVDRALVIQFETEYSDW